MSILRNLTVSALTILQVNTRLTQLSNIVKNLTVNGEADASIVTSGQLALARGGTHADLSATGGTSKAVMQEASGADFTVRQLASGDLSDASSIPVVTPVLGEMIYANNTPSWAALAGNSTSTAKFLQQTGTGAVSAAPTWFDLFGTANVFTANQAITQTTDGSVSWTITDNSAGTSANARFSAVNNAAVTGLLASHGSGRTATRYGVTLANIVEVLASGGSLGLLLGTTDNSPVVFGANGIEVGRFDGSTGLRLGGGTNVHGSYAKFIFVDEEITLSTLGTTTDSAAFLLGPGTVVLFALVYITQTISGGGVTKYRVGDATQNDRFLADSATLTSGSTQVGIQQWRGSVATDAAGPSQAALAKVRITTDATPTQGKVRVVTLSLQGNAPTS